MRNFQARNHMQAMRVGDRGFFYHSGDIKAVVGVVEVIAEAHPRLAPPTIRAGSASTSAQWRLPAPVTLVAIKAEPRWRRWCW